MDSALVGDGIQMTIKEAYDFLYSVQHIENQIKICKTKQEALRLCLLPQGIRYDLDKIQTTPTDRMSDIEADIADLSAEIARLNDEKYEQIKRISVAISALDDDVEQVVLNTYYIGRLPMKKVADTVHYSIRGAYKIKRRAVQHLAKTCTKCS